jgi:chromosome segregation ATPase
MAKKSSDDSALTNAQVLGLIGKFSTEWAGFRNLWDQLTPSFQHMGDVVHRFEQISNELPRLETQHAELIESLSNLREELVEGRQNVAQELARLKESGERDLEPIKKELQDTREKVLATQGALANAERTAQTNLEKREAECQALEYRVSEARRQLENINRLTGALNA